jgi:hypothetical protein
MFQLNGLHQPTPPQIKQEIRRIYPASAGCNCWTKPLRGGKTFKISV